MIMSRCLSPVILLLFFNFSVHFVKPQEPMKFLNELPEENCEGFTCIRKCCPEDKYVNITSCDTPIDQNILWQPVFHDASTLAPVAEPPKNLKYLSGIMSCDAFPLRPSVNRDEKYYLLQDGRLHVPLYKKNYSPDKYCVDSFAISIEKVEQMALLCFEEEVNTKPNKICKEIETYLYPMLLIISCIFLTITLFVYIWIPELRGKLHGRCLMSLVSSLLVAYIFTFVVMITMGELYPTACLICATVKYFTLLASFFWLNVMCFDIWRSLRSLRPTPGVRSSHHKRFCLYSLYAWGSSFVIALVAIVIDTRPESFTDVTRPNFVNNRQSCWFEVKKTLWYYFYSIVAILLMVNLFFFVHVIYIIVKSQYNKALQEARSQNRDRLWLYGKLFLVMGISWIFEVISWKHGTCEVWIITDIVNYLQGFIIFLVFVCKKSTRQLVIQRIPRNMSFSKSFNSFMSGSTRLTTSSNLRNRTRRDVTKPPESHGLMNLVETSTQNPVTDIQKEEDCPSIRRESLTSEEEGVSSPEKSSLIDQDIKGERVNGHAHIQAINAESAETATENGEDRDPAVGNELMPAVSKPSATYPTLHAFNEDNLELSEGKLSTSSLEERLPLMTPEKQEVESSVEKSDTEPQENSLLLSEDNERLESSG